MYCRAFRKVNLSESNRTMEFHFAKDLAERQQRICGHDVYLYDLLGYHGIICFDCLLGPELSQRSIANWRSLFPRIDALNEKVARLEAEIAHVKQENFELRALPDAPDHLAARASFRRQVETRMEDASAEVPEEMPKEACTGPGELDLGGLLSTHGERQCDMVPLTAGRVVNPDD